ncbi:MAG: DUF1080 domain-containing protein [Bacteroidota bacterium]|jgi:hypothetical protein|nr:DUF1080 domain-containing protein [Terrimonas sp.]
MKKISVHFLFSLAMWLTLSSVAAQSSLFNGKNISGWQIHGTEKWYVENGELICESGPDKEYGYLSTLKSYKDFVLKLEFKQEANGNSGVFFRSSVNGTIIKGWQVEVAPIGQHTGGIYESYGRGWLIKPVPEKEKYLKMGEWNRLKIQVKGSKVTTYLNGHEMIQLQDDKIAAGEGGIALQIHSGGGIKVRWRNLKIKEL